GDRLRERPAISGEEHPPDFPQVGEALGEERYLALTGQDRAELLRGEVRQAGRVPERPAGFQSAGERRRQRVVAVVRLPAKPDAPARLAPEAEVQGVQREEVVRRLFGGAPPV